MSRVGVDLEFYDIRCQDLHVSIWKANGKARGIDLSDLMPSELGNSGNVLDLWERYINTDSCI